jgi:adenylylsulfate kinase
MSTNISWHQSTVTRTARENMNGHRSCILWFTGLSGAGKSTLAHRVEELLFERGCRTFVFDGDNVRHGLCKDLGFSADDRQENIRRIGEMSKLIVEAGVIAITAFISPYRRDREMVRSLVAEGDFIEVFCDAPLAICEQRDVKGLYRKARSGELPEFTGITSPYEVPVDPEITVQTGRDGLDICAAAIIEFLEQRQRIRKKEKGIHHEENCP